jgi:NAD(P)-dependent dehydrogenase (short-subunit alcohol dehydrogenase family)
MMNDPLDFSGKVALVTGAASGMGLATARAFAEAGAAVVLAEFKEDAVKAAAERLVATGHRALAVRCDVSDDAEVAAMVDRAVTEFGRLDAAFNNAGVMARIAPTADSTREDWDRVIGTNLRGVWSCMKHEMRQMERQGCGAIVNNASVGALTGNPGIASYIASKHGVAGLTRTASLEYVKHGIRVNAVNPGLIDTQMMQAIRSARKGGFVSYVGVPHGVELDGMELFFAHVHPHGGPAPVRRFLPELIDLVWKGKINPGKVFDLTLPLDQVAEGHRAMDERRAIKALLRP